MNYLLDYFASMKSVSFIITGVLLLLGVMATIAFINTDKETKPLELVLRNIGHQLLLHSKDSVSRVLPVQKLAENSYQLSFQNSFEFVPDSLINVVHRELEKYNLPNEYLVSVKDCVKKETVFAFEISDRTGNLLPCTGREQESGCYLIQINFLKKHNYVMAWWLLLLLPFSLFYFYKGKDYRSKIEEKVVSLDKNYCLIGSYQFYPKKNLLYFKSFATTLSEKESKALQIFVENQNEVVERERLMKEIWEDDGLMVMSRNVDVLVSKLRRKFTEDPSIKFINVHGKGYKFVIE